MTATRTTTTTKSRPGARPRPKRRRRRLIILAVLVALPAIAASAFLGYYYVRFSRLVDQRLHGQRERVLPRVYGRPMELHRGQALGERQLVDRLNDLGYAERAEPGGVGEFAVSDQTVTLIPRTGSLSGRLVRATFNKPPVAKPGAPPTPGLDRLERLEVVKGGARDSRDPRNAAAHVADDRRAREAAAGAPDAASPRTS